MSWDPGWLKDASDAMRALSRARYAIGEIVRKQDREDWSPAILVQHTLKILRSRCDTLGARLDRVLRDGPYESEHGFDEIVAELDQITELATWVVNR